MGDAVKHAFVIGCALLAFITTVHAATTEPTFCSAAVPPQQLTPHEFAKATLASLWYARNGANRGTEFEQARGEANNNTFSLITMMMRFNKYSTNDFICAKRSIEPFMNGDKATAGAAKFLAMIYDAHINLNARMLDLLKKLGSTSQVDLMDQMSSFEVERDQRYADLVKPTAFAFGSLVDFKRTDDPNRTTRLIITKAQKQELVKWANEHFVEFTNGTPEKQWADPAKTAHMALDLFKDRKCSDE